MAASRRAAAAAAPGSSAGRPGAASGRGGGERVRVAGELADGVGCREPDDVGEVARLSHRDPGLHRLEHGDPVRVQGGDRGGDDGLADAGTGARHDEDPALVTASVAPRR